MYKRRPKRGRRVRDDGSVWYDYRKRKQGRKNKRGPKKVLPPPKKRGRKPIPHDFIIVLTNHNKQCRYIGQYSTIQEAYEEKRILKELNKQVIFPKEYNNNGRNNPKIYDTKKEYLILRRSMEGESPAQLRNEYGQIVDHVVTSGQWIILDKFPYEEEETFWVYGFDPKSERKTFDWIYKTFITDVIEDSYAIVNVYLYNNKVIFRYDDGDFEFVICKNISDAIRMYNLIEKRKKRSRQVVMTGSTGGHTSRSNDIIDMIRKKTGWSNKKIWERSTRH